MQVQIKVYGRYQISSVYALGTSIKLQIQARQSRHDGDQHLHVHIPLSNVSQHLDPKEFF